MKRFWVNSSENEMSRWQMLSLNAIELQAARDQIRFSCRCALKSGRYRTLRTQIELNALRVRPKALTRPSAIFGPPSDILLYQSGCARRAPRIQTLPSTNHRGRSYFHRP